MQGDKVEVISSIIEDNGEYYPCVQISEKPNFMLESEYTVRVLDCAVEAVLGVCEKMGNGDYNTMDRYLKYMMKKVDEKRDTTL